MADDFRILAIDGGGFRGVYPAYILKRLEETYRINWCQHFDLIAGTSTGAIVAAGLACGLSAGAVFDFYEKHGKEIFCKRWLCRKGLFGSQYRNGRLRSILSEVFQNRSLGEITTPLVLPATDIGNGRVHVFKSGYDSGFVRDPGVSVCDAVLASCAAPTFFDPYPVGKYLLADGGLWANSPALVAAIEAKRRLGQDLNDIRILSVGTGASHTFYARNIRWWKRPLGWGFLTRWGRSKFISMLLALQAQNATNMCKLLLQDSQLLRVNFDSDTDLALDDPNDFDDLVSRADKEFTHRSADIGRFLGISTGETQC